MTVKVNGEWVFVDAVLSRGLFDSTVVHGSLGLLEGVLGFPVVEACAVDNRVLVVRRDVPPEWEGLTEDTFCYDCRI